MNLMRRSGMLRLFPSRLIYIIGPIVILCLLYKSLSVSEENVGKNRVKRLSVGIKISKQTHNGTGHLKILEGPSLVQHSNGDPKGFHRIIHLDLKGAPPKLEYLKKVIPFFKKWGATGLLIEYEDTFPYSNNMKVLARSNAYDANAIAEILKISAENDLIVIPLVQTFGHFEFVLKHPKFNHIREVKSVIKNLNPAHKDSFPVVKEMIDQILSLHPSVKHIHIGCDEVYYMGHSEESRDLMKDKGLDKGGLFLYHVVKILQYIRDKYPGVKPIMWDDMLRKMDTGLLQKHNMGQLVEPMVWGYVPSIDQKFPSSFWQRYSTSFNAVWTASSFKGATGQSQIAVNIDYHLQNHKTWIKVMKEARSQYNINILGIALTGWTRYDHTLPLCELLPVGLPSLTACLQCITHGGFDLEVHKQVTSLLTCDHQLNLLPAETPKDHSHCTFPGSDIYDAVIDLRMTQMEIGRFANELAHSDGGREKMRSRVMSHIKGMPPVLLTALEGEAVHEFLQTQLITSLRPLPDLQKEASAKLKELYPHIV